MPSRKQTLHRNILLILLAMFASACSGLAGEPIIVATVAPDVAENVPLDPPNLANGRAVYVANCTQCHAENGSGDGALVQSGEVPRMPSFLEGTHVRQQTPESYFDIITNGNLQNLMPPWADALTEQERWDVAMYVYTLNYTPELIEQGAALAPDDLAADFSLASDREIADTFVQSQSISIEEAEAIAAYQRLQTLARTEELEGIELPESATITVTVTNETEGESIPADLEVVLAFGDVTTGENYQEIAQPIANGQAIFADIPVNAAHSYVALINYDQVNFFTEPFVGWDLAEDLTLSLPINGRTDRPDAVTLSKVDYFVEQLSVDGLGTGLVFTQTNTYTNPTDRVFLLVPQPNADGTSSPPISTIVELPIGSVIITLDDTSGQRYITLAEQNIIVDTAPIYPGEHTITATYFVPYESGAIIDQPLTTDLEGSITIDLASPALRIVSEDFVEVDASADDVERTYQSETNIERGNSLTFEVAGSIFVGGNTSEDPNIVTGNVLMPILVIFGVGFVGLAVVLFWLQTRSTTENDINKLVQQLATLDKMHDAGQINHDVYRKQQADLTRKLAELRGDKPPASNP